MARIRLGMIGGGQGALIGAVHRLAARMDDEFELVAGVLSSTPERAHASAEAIGLPRSHGSVEAMLAAEAARPDGIEAVAIVTPNHQHAGPAIACLAAGLHVICDKPLSATPEEAEALAAAVARAPGLFILTHNYTAYPMIREARARVAAGELGPIRVVQVEYAQGWLSRPIEAEGHVQASWRTDPARSGAGGCTGDIGTHALNLVTHVTGLVPEALAADLQSFVPGRALDDNGHVMLRFEGGARGMLWCSQVAIGQENGLRLRIFGEKGGLEWAQEDPNYLWLSLEGQPKQRLARGGPGSGPAALQAARVPGGHPEGWQEGFGTLYRDVAHAIRAHARGEVSDRLALLPGIEAGLEGMRFIDAAVRSSQADGAWIRLGREGARALG